MDIYNNGDQGLTLQEMIDYDIKGVDFEAGISSDTLLSSFDFSNTFDHFSSEIDIKEEPLFGENDMLHTFFDDYKTFSKTSTESYMNNSSMTNSSFDVDASFMVNPSLVLPSPHHPTHEKAESFTNYNSKIKTEVNDTQVSVSEHSQIANESQIVPIVLQPYSSATPTLDSTPQQTFIYQNAKIISCQESVQSLNNSSPNVFNASQIITTPMIFSSSTNVSPIIQSNKSIVGLTYNTTTKTKAVPKYRRDRLADEKMYPKPAYSYACLIALSLKNSITGCLPVSEIYSFMCEHFPYFRTAPNGWKNSVRHNLSLNKCFEKIEKPVTPGNSQRKGCLWALNPLKVTKMDEEVQKWSKKDLPGIRDAMSCPETLESLEKGEMKFETTSGASSCSEDSEDDEVDLLSMNGVEHGPIKVISSLNDHEGTTTCSFVGIKSNDSQPDFSTLKQNGHEPEYILPHSTLPEINIQSNGSLIDDFGHEIKMNGDVNVLNPSSCSSLLTSSNTSLILKKMNSPLRSNGSLRAGVMYTATNASGLPYQHTGVGRLVVTNGELA